MVQGSGSADPRGALWVGSRCPIVPPVPDILLHPDRDKSVRRRHPWLLSGAVKAVRGDDAHAGAWSRVISADGQVLGHGYFAPGSQIRVRMVIFGETPGGGAADEAGLIAKRIERSVQRRRSDPLLAGMDALRLVNAEADGLPGVIVDQYRDVAVLKLASAGASLRRDEIAEAVREATGAACGFERADTAACRREGVAAQQGSLWGGDPPVLVPIREHERRYEVDVVEGQKTGFYLDQRDSRDLVERLASGRRVLDLYCYTGGFAVAAARGGAVQVTAVDSSAAAIDRTAAHLALNAPDCDAAARRGDVPAFLREGNSPFDLIIADPPPMARRKADVMRATRAHKDLLMRCMRRAAPGALILCFSCSQHLSADLFRKVLFGAALDVRRSPQILRSLGAPCDHPVSVDHPEGEYLRGLLLRM